MRVLSIGVITVLILLASIVTFQLLKNYPNFIEEFSDEVSDSLSNEIEELLVHELANEESVLGYGLEISDPTFEIIKEDSNTTLVINGIVKNVVSETVRIPKLKGAFLNKNEEEIIVWVYEADHAEAKAGETVNYSTSVTNPPPGLTGMIVTFISDEEVKKLPGKWQY